MTARSCRLQPRGPMYLVELGSGKDTVYSSARELTAAIRRGDLDPQARIYHRAADQWLPITVHPEFRRLTAEQDSWSAQQLARRQWTFLRDAAAQGAPGAGPPVHSLPSVLIPPRTAPSWRESLGLAFRRLRYLTHL